MGANLTDPITAVYELSQVDHLSRRMAVSVPHAGRAPGLTRWYHSGCALDAAVSARTTHIDYSLICKSGDARIVGAPRRPAHRCYACNKPVHRPRSKPHV